MGYDVGLDVATEFLAHVLVKLGLRIYPWNIKD